jgi:cysteine synthase A
MAGRFENILETIGRTPVVKIAKLAPPGVELFVKLEAFNPLGSVKDRLALGVIEAAERSGELKPGQTVIEAPAETLALVLPWLRAQRLSARCHDGGELQCRTALLMRSWVPGSDNGIRKGQRNGGQGARTRTDHGGSLPTIRERSEPDLFQDHGVEILRIQGWRLDYWVTGMGTGGTLKGVARC